MIGSTDLTETDVVALPMDDLIGLVIVLYINDTVFPCYTLKVTYNKVFIFHKIEQVVLNETTDCRIYSL